MIREKNLKKLLAKHAVLLRIKSYEELKQSQKPDTPSYLLDAIVDQDINFTAYSRVSVLPEKGKPGVFYILPDGTMAVWDSTTLGFVTTGSVITVDANLDSDSMNPIANKPVSQKFELIQQELDNTGGRTLFTTSELSQNILGFVELDLADIPNITIDEIIPNKTLIYDINGTIGVVNFVSVSTEKISVTTISIVGAGGGSSSSTTTHKTSATLSTTVSAETEINKSTVTGFDAGELVIDGTLIYDASGTLGVVTGFIDPILTVATITVAGSGGGSASDGIYHTTETLNSTIGGTTTVDESDVSVFDPAKMVIGETLVYDDDGTIGVLTAYADPDLTLTSVTNSVQDENTTYTFTKTSDGWKVEDSDGNEFEYNEPINYRVAATSATIINKTVGDSTFIPLTEIRDCSGGAVSSLNVIVGSSLVWDKNGTIGVVSGIQTTPTAGVDLITTSSATEIPEQDISFIAPEYDNTATYSENDVVVYNGKRYFANTDIDTAEDWDPAHWTEQSVQEAIDDALGDIETILHTLNSGNGIGG